MSKILLRTNDSEPDSPSSGAVALFADSAGAMKAKDSAGVVSQLSGGRGGNLVANGGFWFAQRQTPGTLTTYSNTSGRTYGLDRWAITCENASVQVARGDSASAPATGLSTRYYARLLKLTNAGKMIFSQVFEGTDVIPYRGRRVRVQIKARNVVGSHTLRIALLYLTSAGTIDSIPATFVSAFGAVGTDPTWGTNLTAIAPSIGNAQSTISGAGLSCTLTSDFRLYGGVFALPSDFKNLVLVAFTNGQPAANDEIDIAEVAMHEGDEEQEFYPHDIVHELQRCLRFCAKTFALDTAPAQNLGAATGEFRFQAAVGSTAINRSPAFRFHVPMRAAPTVTTYNPGASSAEARDMNASANCTAIAINNISESGFNVHATGTISTAAGNSLGIHLLMESEL